MKRLIAIAIVCVVVDQLKSEQGWLTHCRGHEVDGEVILGQEVARGRAVTYRPFIVLGDEIIHGDIRDIGDSAPEKSRVEESSDTGKAAL